MKKINATIVCLVVGMHIASAQSTVLYQQDFGSTNGGTTLAAVGWSQVLLGSGASGIYAQPGAKDQTTRASLPTSTLYCGASATGVQIFYTTSGAGAGTGGDSAFTSINPSLYTNLNISLESQYSYQGTLLNSFFAVQVGGNWYVSTNQPFISGGSAGATFYPASITYNPAATNWNNLTVSSTVTIGAQASANLSGLITGIGVVQLFTGVSYWDYNNFLITSISNVGVNPPILTGAPLSETNYNGAGASFAVAATGTQPFTYYWKKNGAPLGNGGNISGANTSILNVGNISGTDVATYSVIVSNSAGYFDTSTNTTATLTVNSLPSDYLYAETFPFVDPLLVGYPLSVVGWSNAIPDNFQRLYQNAGGDGAAYAYEGSAITTVYYVSTNSDTGVSGLPFTAINPGSHPTISLSVDIAPSYQPANVTAYFAVEMSGGKWYVNQSPISVDTSTATATFTTYAQQFSTLAADWNTLTISPTGGTIGGQASSALTGNIIGAGIVFVYSGSGGNFNIDNFLLTTDATPPTAPAITSSPYSQTAYAGAGVSFSVASTGTRPLNYSWQRNNVTLSDNGRITGSASNVLTIANVNSGDQGTYVAFVSNGAGSDNSANYINTSLTVNAPPSGLLYAETFPFVGPGTANEPISAVGWASLLSGNQNTLAQNFNGDGYGVSAGFVAGTTAYVTSTANDTGVSGLPFPALNPTLYPTITFSVDIAPAATPANVTAYLAVAVGTNWYVSSTSLAVPTGSATTTFSTYTQVYNPAASWNNLTLTPGNGATIGSPVGAALSGYITGAGLVFVDTGSGGTFNFDNFIITGTATGLGQVTVSGVTNNIMTLTWSGVPNTRLQSTTSLNSPVSWSDVAGTTGQNSTTIPISGQQKMFFRLIQ